MRSLLAAAAALGLAAVGFGAFAAHGINDPRAQEWLRTGSLYSFVHALAVFAAARFEARVAAGLFVAGALVFSGTLYVMALGGPRMLGAMTPVGGLLLMAGWVALGWSTLRRQV